MIKAVLDRFEGTIAILLVGDASQKMDIARELLPGDVREGQWLQVDIQDGKIVRVVLDVAETSARKRRIAAKLDRLRRGEDRKPRS